MTNQKSKCKCIQVIRKVFRFTGTPKQKKNRDNIFLHYQGNQQLLKYLNINFLVRMFKNLLRFEKVTVMHHLSRYFQNFFSFYSFLGGGGSPTSNNT